MTGLKVTTELLIHIYVFIHSNTKDLKASDYGHVLFHEI